MKTISSTVACRRAGAGRAAGLVAVAHLRVSEGVGVHGVNVKRKTPNAKRQTERKHNGKQGKNNSNTNMAGMFFRRLQN